MKQLDEMTMQADENNIPKLAEDAIRQAFITATISHRCTVVEAVDGQLIELSPDGTRKIIRDLQAPTEVEIGQKIVRKKR